MPSVVSAVEPTERPTRILYSDTPRLATMPTAAASRLNGMLLYDSGTSSLRIDSNAASAAVTTITPTITRVATSSMRPKPEGKRRVAGRLARAKANSSTKVVRTSPALWRPSARTPAERPATATPSSKAEATPSAMALMITARTASRLSYRPPWECPPLTGSLSEISHQCPPHRLVGDKRYSTGGYRRDIDRAASPACGRPRPDDRARPLRVRPAPGRPCAPRRVPIPLRPGGDRPPEPGCRPRHPRSTRGVDGRGPPGACRRDGRPGAPPAHRSLASDPRLW